MAISTKIDPLGKDFLLEFAADLNDTGRSAILAGFAKEQLAEAQKINQASAGYIPDHDTFVDGIKGAREESVKPDGVIVYEFQLVVETLEWIEAALLKASPHRSGRYMRSHVLLADGAEVQYGADIPQAEKYIFLNSQPYARKIEPNSARPALSSQAPEGVYQSIAEMAKRRFSNIAAIKYTFEGLISSNTDLEAWARVTKQVRKIAPKTTEAWNRRQPAIVVTVK